MDSLSPLPEGPSQAWVRDYLKPRYPELVEPFLDALHIHATAKTRGELEPSELDRLLAHATSSRSPLGENAAGLLGDLLQQFTSVNGAIRELAAGKHLRERLAALVALCSSPSTDLHVELYTLLLRDRSARIRSLAADKIVGAGMVELASELEAAANREKNEELRQELFNGKELLVQGFYVLHKESSVWVTCRGPGSSCVGKVFSLTEFESKGHEWITTQLSAL